MRLWIIAAAVNGFIAVAMGALAAHRLQHSLAVEALDWIETGARFGLAHGLALLGVGLLMGRAVGPSLALAIAGWGFLVGTVLFSGTLYVMGLMGWSALGAVVPFGGVGLLLGWGALFAYGLGLRGGSAGTRSG